MRGKVDEPSINETGSKSERETIQSNPYEKTNVNQEQEKQVTRERDSELAPPPYATVVQPSPNLQLKPTIIVQNSSLNNQYVPPTRIRERHPINILCPICGVTVRTRVETLSTIITIILAVILFFFCCCLVVIPFCTPRCKKTTHYCPNCNCQLAKVDEFD